MRDSIEFRIAGHEKYKLIAIVPILNSSDYHVTLNGQVHYGGTQFPLSEAKEHINFLRKFLKIDNEPLVKIQDGVVLPHKRKRRTKVQMEEAKRELENAKRKRSRINSSVTKKPRGRPPKAKRNL